MENEKTATQAHTPEEQTHTADVETPPEADAGEQVPGPNTDAAHEVLAATEQKAEEHWSRYLRAAAELENLRKRSKRDLEHAHKFALERFAMDLLPVKDSLEMGLAAVAEANSDETVNKLKEGKEMTLKLLTRVFERFGITEVQPQGERFNPDRHEAMAMQESSEVEPNTVLSVIQKGYLLNDRLLRPARVMVAKEPVQ